MSVLFTEAFDVWYANSTYFYKFSVENSKMPVVVVAYKEMLWKCVQLACTS